MRPLSKEVEDKVICCLSQKNSFRKVANSLEMSHTLVCYIVKKKEFIVGETKSK